MRHLLIAVLLLLPLPATAESWQVDEELSEILFTYIRADQADEGVFHDFAGEGRFDPANPFEAELEIRIESRSIDLNDTLASAFATSAEWFDSKNHPLVVYRLKSLMPGDEPDVYVSTGTLMVRGKTQEIEAPLTLRLRDGSATAEGALVLNRTDYLLGVGPSAAFVTIGPEVIVAFRLQAVPVN